MPATCQQIVDAMEQIAPARFAESWDNVGLIVRPPREKRISTAVLCIDMTLAVVDEALGKKAEMVIAYHPPLFNPIKRLDPDQPAVRAMAEGLAVYSPHTALDAAPGGVNDWLADGLGKGKRAAISAVADPAERDQCKVVVFTPADCVDRLRSAMADAGAGVIGDYTQCSFNLSGFGTFTGGESTNPTVGRRGRMERAEEIRLEMVCPRSVVPSIARAINQHHPYEEPAWELYPLEPKTDDSIGQGRLVTLDQPVALSTLVKRIKQHLGLDHVRVAEAAKQKVRTIALCAGAGGSVIGGQDADVYFTGEMRHHDVLAANARGISVVLCDHTNTERPYLKVLARRLRQSVAGAKFILARADREPLRVV
jgi:dinuclear metal center YbgI/SA1388 family protein